MKQAHLYDLFDLLEDIKGTHKMIQLHNNDASGFMLEQYKAKKGKLIGQIIDQLVSPTLGICKKHL